MKIAFVVHDYSRSFGHGNYVVQLAERFCFDHEVHIFANTFGEKTNARIQYRKVPALRWNSFSTILSFLPAATISLEPDFDIIHTQGLCAFKYNVVTAHICTTAWMNSLAVSTGRWKLEIFGHIIAPLERLIYRNGSDSWTIAVSDRVRNDLSKYYGYNSVRTKVIHHGVDATRFHPGNKNEYREPLRANLGYTNRDTVFLFVGDLRKGAWQAMNSLKNTSNIKLLFISRTLASDYKHHAEEMGLQNRISFLPASEQLEQYYAASDGFLFPSPYDAFGMVILEAMATGLPVIVSKQAGAAELIEHMKDGVLLNNCFDEEEIRASMQMLSDNSLLRETLGEAARRKSEQHSWDRVAQQTLKVYEKVISGQNS